MAAGLQPAIPFGYKFSAIGLSVQLSPAFTFGQVAPGLRTVQPDDFHREDWWTAAFGGVHLEELRHLSLFIVAEMPSSAPDVLDVENSMLNEKASLWLSALLLSVEDQWVRPAVQLSGGHAERGLVVRLAEIPNQPQTPQHAAFRRIELRGHHLQVSDLLAAATLSQKLAFVPQLREREWRLRRALSIYFQARDEAMDFDKLYQFVRTLEAIVHVPRGKGADLFSSRATLFTGVAHETWLREIYKTRSLIQHVNEDQLLMPFDRGRMIEAVRMLIGAEWLARKVLMRILATPPLRSAFGNAASAEAFWALPRQEREGLWGAELNVAEAFGAYDLDRMTDQQLGKVD